jgi:hypothetical protein
MKSQQGFRLFKTIQTHLTQVLQLNLKYLKGRM